MSRDAMHTGITLLLQLQRHLKYLPKRKLIKDLVRKLVKEAGLEDDKRKKYFTLLATCALQGREPMYFNFKRRRKHGRKERNERRS